MYCFKALNTLFFDTIEPYAESIESRCDFDLCNAVSK